MAGDGVGEKGAADHREEAGGGGRDDQPPVDQALAAVAQGPGDGAGEDGGEGGADGDQRGRSQDSQARVAHDRPADAEQGAQHPGDEPQEQGERIAQQPGRHGR
ncbi:MAG TPA: hypothetical protein VFJ69_16265 [Actinomycetota bacterium]|nr:hypothetical protein [Actinomycetota bacterium]